MPRKFFRKFLPSHAAIKENRYVARLGSRLHHHNLWHLHRRSVAGGVAVGLFAGLVPGSNPVQFTAGALLAIAFRVNLPLAVLVTLYSNPFTIVPLYYLAFKIGQFVLFQNGVTQLPATPSFDAHGIGDWLQAAFGWMTTVGKPLLVGVPLLALILAAVGYFLVRLGWRIHAVMAWRLRRKRRSAAISR